MKTNEKLKEHEQLGAWIIEEYQQLQESKQRKNELVKEYNLLVDFILEEYQKLQQILKQKTPGTMPTQSKRTSLTTGTSKHKYIQRFESRIYINKKKLFLGYFDAQSDAAWAYRIALRIKENNEYTSRFHDNPKELREYIYDIMSQK